MHRLVLFLVGLLVTSLTAATPLYAQLRADAEPQQLTGDDRSFVGPKWSPDGTRIAAAGDGYAGIFIIDVASGEVRTLTDQRGAGYGFSWAPDDDAILARVARFDGPRRTDAVMVFDVATGSAAPLTDFRNDLSALPHWDETGDRVFLYANRSLEVFTLRDEAAFKTGDAERLEWASGDAGLARIRLSSEEVIAADVDLPGEATVLNVTPSPDGSRVAFEVLGGNLFVTDADGGGAVDLGPGNRPSWSPDGEWLAYTRTEDDGHTFTSSDVYAVRPDGSEQVRLTDTPGRLEMNPAWSPDGARIAFDDFNDGAIYILPVSR